MRLRRKPNIVPRMERCSHLFVTPPTKFKGQWQNELKCENLHIELGCGKGRFTVETAKANPDIFFIGLEKISDAIINAVESADSEGLQNLRFINALADNLDDYFAPGEVSRIYINFCDPWPSNRHIKRRLTSPRFLKLYKYVLCTAGELHFKTDNLPLFEYSLKEFEFAGFQLSEVTRDLHKNGVVGVMTDYERKFHDMGMPICRVVASV